MRYNVNQVVLFMYINFEAAEPRMGNLFFPWKDKLIDVSFKKLTCKEHHRVPGDWDDEIQYDGFIFTETIDGKEVQYNNQYPRASYGQLDDSANWMIIDYTTDDYHWYRDAGKQLEIVLRGIKELKEREPDWAKALQEHLDDLIKRIGEQGFDVKIEPHVFKKLDGTTESYPDILSATITPKETVAI